MFSVRSLAALIMLTAASAARIRGFADCTVRNDQATGRGSLAHCLTKANDAGPGDFTIKLSKSLRGGSVIDLTNQEDGSCVRLPSVFNDDAQEALKTVIIRGPRTGKGAAPAISIVAPPTCSAVLVFGVDVSVDISNLAVIGGNVGLAVSGAATPGDAIEESVTLTNTAFIGQGLYGVEMLDITTVHIAQSEFIDSGGDGLLYEHVFGTLSEYDISITSSKFTSCVDDGLDLRPLVNRGHIDLSLSTFSDNGDSGALMFGPLNGTAVPPFFSELSLKACLFERNGDQGLITIFINYDVVEASQFNENLGDGIDIISGVVSLLTKSTFSNNGDDGAEFTETVVEEILLCSFNNNAGWGIELEIVIDETIDDRQAAIVELEKSTIKANGFGAFLCERETFGEAAQARGTKLALIEAREIGDVSSHAEAKRSGELFQ